MNDVEPPYNSHKLPRILTSSYIRIPHLAENKSECVQTQDPENFQDGGGARKTMIPYPEFLLVNFADVTVSTPSRSDSVGGSIFRAFDLPTVIWRAGACGAPSQ